VNKLQRDKREKANNTRENLVQATLQKLETESDLFL